jgi:hydrogenase maturation factor HypF (carbamoyltransferase family)
MKFIKSCKNPECDSEIFEYLSSKREYCNDKCKNRAAYLRKMEEEGEFIKKDKAIKNNYKILKKLKELGINEISGQTLFSHGFNFSAFHKDQMIIHKGEKVFVSCLYDLNFTLKNNNLIFI